MTESEFSLPVRIAELTPNGLALKRRASEAQREKLADRLRLSAVENFEINLHIRPITKKPAAVGVEGSVSATITQPCSVTLEPVETRIEMPVSLQFEEEIDVEDQQLEEIDITKNEPPEPIIDGGFDIGEAMVQLVAIEIDPFPRQPDLPFEDYASAPGNTAISAPAPPDNPFAVLAELKNKLDKP